jgi:hypothetical protein
MIEARRGNDDAASKYFYQAQGWLATHPPDDKLRRFHAEVADALQRAGFISDVLGKTK